MTETLTVHYETLDNNNEQLNSHALAFLQSVYGLDRRLEGLSQTNAMGLTNWLLHEYGLHYTETTHDTPWDNPSYDTAVQAVSLYVQGKDMADIASATSKNRDVIDVELGLHDVALRLRSYDQQQQQEDPRNRPLESLLRQYAGEPENGRGARRMVPLGGVLFPIIEESWHTPVGQNTRLEQALEARRTELLHLEYIAREAERELAEYAASPEFRRAAARQGHTKDGEVFVIGPGDNDSDSQVLRRMSWLVSTAVFARKDGNTLAEMQEHMNDDYDYHFLAVDHRGEHPRPMGALYAKVQSADSLPSVQDIWHEWGKPVRQAMLEAGLPDLRYYPKVLDIMTIAVLPEFAASGAVMALYGRACRLCDVLGLEYIVNVLDEGAAHMLNKYGNMFLTYAGLEPINYKSRRKGANKSLPRRVHLPSWKAWLLQHNKTAYDKFWSKEPKFTAKRYHLGDVERFAPE